MGCRKDKRQKTKDKRQKTKDKRQCKAAVGILRTESSVDRLGNSVERRIPGASLTGIFKFVLNNHKIEIS
jgi:hypothetical protein